MDQKVGSAFIEIEAKLDKLEGVLKTEIQSLWEKAGKWFSSSFQQSIQGLAGAITSIVSIGAIKQLWGEILGLANNLQQSHIAFTTMLGSAEASEKLLAELSDFAAKTPFELQGIRENAKQLLAMGVSTNELLPTLKSLGDVSAWLSVPLERLAINYGQVMTQWKLTGREMRDFMMAGVPLADELAKNLGVAKEKIWDMISAGQISAEDVKKAFQTMSSEWWRFADMMEQQSKSLGGLMSNLKDEVALTGEAIGNQFLPLASSIVSAISGVVEKIREWVQEHPTATKAIVSFVAVWGGLLALLGAVIPLLWTVAVAFGAISRPVLAVVGSVAGLTSAFIALSAGIKDQEKNIKYAWKSYQDLKKELDENIDAQIRLKKEYEDGTITLAEYKEQIDNLKIKNAELKEAQDKTTMSIEDAKIAIDEVSSAKINNEEKLKRLQEIADKAFWAKKSVQELKNELADLKPVVDRIAKSKEISFAWFWAFLQNNFRDTFSFIPGVKSTQDIEKDYERINNQLKNRLEHQDVFNNLLEKEEEIHKKIEKSWSGGGWSSKQSKAQKEALKEIKEAYHDIEKEINTHNKAIEDAQKKVESLNKKYEEFKKKALEAFDEAKNAVKELNKELSDNEEERVKNLWERYVDLKRKMLEIWENALNVAKNLSRSEIEDKIKGDIYELNGVDPKKLLEYKDLLEEVALIEANTTEEQRKSKDFTEQKSKAQEILNKHLEKQAELEEKKAAALEKQKIAEAFSNGKNVVAGHDKDNELKARYEDEKWALVEITDFKNIQYAQDLYNKSQAILQEKKEIEDKIFFEKVANEELTTTKMRLDQMYTKAHSKEIDKQKSKVDELIQKYHELARAKSWAGGRWARAFGWEVKAWLPYLIWENFKPELFVPSTSGSVVPVNNYNQSKSYHFNGITINTNHAEDFWSEIQNHIGDYT